MEINAGDKTSPGTINSFRHLVTFRGKKKNFVVSVSGGRGWGKFTFAVVRGIWGASVSAIKHPKLVADL